MTKAELIKENERLRARLARDEAPGKESSGTEDAERLRCELAAALEQQTATRAIFRVISRSPADVQAVLDTVAESAVACVTPETPLASARTGIAWGSGASQLDSLCSGRRGTLEGQTVNVADLQAEADQFPESYEIARHRDRRTT